MSLRSSLVDHSQLSRRSRNFLAARSMAVSGILFSKSRVCECFEEGHQILFISPVTERMDGCKLFSRKMISIDDF
jgi:hypothetical protein